MRDNLSIHLNCMNDPFPCSTTNWSPSNIRNGNVSTMCAAETNNSALVFGLDSASILSEQNVSRSVKTNLLNVSMNASIAREFHTNATSQIAICTTGSSEMTSAAILTDIGTTDSATPTDTDTTDAVTPTNTDTTDAATPTDIGATDAATPTDIGTTDTALLTAIGTIDAVTPTDIGTTDAATPTDIGTTDTALLTAIGTTDAATPTDIGTTDALTPLTLYDMLAGVEDEVLKKVSISR